MILFNCSEMPSAQGVVTAQTAALPAATWLHLTLSRTSWPDVPRVLDATSLTPSGAPQGWAPKAWQARAGGRELGWLMVDQVIGKTELITYAVAVDAHGAVKSVEILDYREAHGGEIRLAGWRKQFAGKTGADPLELNKDIKNISGATLSCRHVTEGVQRLLKVYNAALRGAAG